MRGRAARLALVLAVLVGLGVASERWSRALDLTQDRALTLTTETREIVGHIRHRTRVTAFLRHDDPSRAQAAAVLARYHRLNRLITFRLLDPDDSPGEVRRLEVDPIFGGIAVTARGQVERAPTATEQDVTSSLARLVRGVSATVCFTVGHGEPGVEATTDQGLSTAAGALRRNGYRVRAVDLLVEPAVPATCRAVVVVNVTAPLGEAGVALATYLRAGGRALVLADPASTIDLSPLIRPYGLRFDRGLVFEGDPERRLPGDPLTPVLSRFDGAHPVMRHMPPVFFPGTMRVALAGGRIAGLAATTIIRTSDSAYLERAPAEPRFDEGVDVRGPIEVGAAADASENRGGSVRRTRVVAFGDAEFATNGFVDQAGNARLLVRSLDWLTLDEDLVTVSANLPRERPLDFTPGRVRYALFVSAGVVPALWLLAGAMVWAVRRSR